MKRKVTTLPKSENIANRHGRWGEFVAADFLRRGGYEILDRNSRPVERDARLEIDIVAHHRKTDTLVFVEVKQHSFFSPYARRMRSVDKRKLHNLRTACNVWRLKNKWGRAYRFDIIEIYGRPEDGSPIIDHIQQVELFPKKGRFVKW